MNTFTKRDSSSITEHKEVLEVHSYKELLLQESVLELKGKELKLEMEKNKSLLAQCEKLGVF